MVDWQPSPTSGHVIALSEDHKPHDKVESQRIVKAGGFVAPGGFGGPMRVDGVLAVSRGFGDFQFKDPELPPAEHKVTCVPEIRIHARDVRRDELLVCTSQQTPNQLTESLNTLLTTTATTTTTTTTTTTGIDILSGRIRIRIICLAI